MCVYLRRKCYFYHFTFICLLQTVPQIPQPSSLISLMGTVVPQPPPLTGNVDPTKIEEIRRTIYVGNLNSSVCWLRVLSSLMSCELCVFCPVADSRADIDVLSAVWRDQVCKNGWRRDPTD